MRKTLSNICISLILLGLSGGLLFAAAIVPGFAESYAHSVYPFIVRYVGGFASLVPCSLSEIILYILIIFAASQLLCIFRHPLRRLSRILLILSVLALLYSLNCGINYRAETFSAYVGLEPGKHSAEELTGLCEFLTEKVCETAELAPTKADSLSAKNANGTAAMARLGETYPILSGYYPQPKPLIFSYILSVQQVTGVYSPFTVEANYNRDMPNYNKPHTICHELSHLKGFMHEDEANFIGYLACISSDSTEFQYSGYLTAWVYAGNKLHGEDRDTYFALYESLPARAKDDLAENNRFWDQYRGKPAEIQEKVNNAYLKANGQFDGTKSYGRFVNLMLAYYKEN